jgi:hypothetical protein
VQRIKVSDAVWRLLLQDRLNADSYLSCLQQECDCSVAVDRNDPCVKVSGTVEQVRRAEDWLEWLHGKCTTAQVHLPSHVKWPQAVARKAEGSALGVKVALVRERDGWIASVDGLKAEVKRAVETLNSEALKATPMDANTQWIEVADSVWKLLLQGSHLRDLQEDCKCNIVVDHDSPWIMVNGTEHQAETVQISVMQLLDKCENTRARPQNNVKSSEEPAKLPRNSNGRLRARDRGKKNVDGHKDWIDSGAHNAEVRAGTPTTAASMPSTLGSLSPNDSLNSMHESARAGARTPSDFGQFSPREMQTYPPEQAWSSSNDAWAGNWAPDGNYYASSGYAPDGNYMAAYNDPASACYFAPMPNATNSSPSGGGVNVSMPRPAARGTQAAVSSARRARIRNTALPSAERGDQHLEKPGKPQPREARHSHGDAGANSLATRLAQQFPGARIHIGAPEQEPLRPEKPPEKPKTAPTAPETMESKMRKLQELLSSSRR